jgi:hypothetical protein
MRIIVCVFFYFCAFVVFAVGFAQQVALALEYHDKIRFGFVLCAVIGLSLAIARIILPSRI